MLDKRNYLTQQQFNALDHLHTIDADTRPVQRDDLATTLGIHPEAAHARMLRLKKTELVEIHQEHRHDLATYSITELGMRLYRAENLRMIGVTAPPPLHPSIERATLATLALHAYGTEAA